MHRLELWSMNNYIPGVSLSPALSGVPSLEKKAEPARSSEKLEGCRPAPGREPEQAGRHLLESVLSAPQGFPCGSTGKASACNTGDLGSIPGEGKGYPVQYSGLESSMDYIVHGVAKSQT